jgi:cell division septation protein DedD
MSRSYYVIELSARWLTVLLVALAIVMVLAFALGYGAAWSVLSNEKSRPAATVATASIAPTDIPEVVIPTPVATATDRPTPTAPRQPTATQAPPKPSPTKVPTAVEVEFFVQVLASSSSNSVATARTRLEGLGFSRDHQHLITLQEPGTGKLYKLRVGPFPDRSSADRVAQRMSAAGFPDSWVVVE